jgi:hypothetical protein
VVLYIYKYFVYRSVGSTIIPRPMNELAGHGDVGLAVQKVYTEYTTTESIV